MEVSEGTSAWDFSPKSHKWRAKCSKGAVEAVLIGCAECELSKGVCVVLLAASWLRFSSLSRPTRLCQCCVFSQLGNAVLQIVLQRRLEDRTVWPSGLRRWLQAPVRKGVGSNPTAVSLQKDEPGACMSAMLRPLPSARFTRTAAACTGGTSFPVPSQPHT